MQKLSNKNLLLIGITLFSMFFGAGNLIFPPYLGAQAGSLTWIAFLGFAISAIGLPILGVIAVAKSGGLSVLAGRVHPLFAPVFTLLIYLSIGPCLAIPRTASTSFEMAAVPFLPEGISLGLVQFIYSIVFFSVALLIALAPSKLTDRLGKKLAPCLFVLILIIFVACMIAPFKNYGVPTATYANHSFVQGFLDGYLTMDTIAALNFGIIISMNIRAKGVTDDSSVVKETIKAGWIAGALFVIVYAALTHIGALSGGTFGIATNGAQTLTKMVLHLFGNVGLVILALIFLIACLNTCIGLISCCSEYFTTVFPRFTYKTWACFFAFISMIISNVGLNKILEISVPVLNFLYPVSIVLIILSFFHKHIQQWRYIYPTAILFTGTISLIYALDQTGIALPFITALAHKIPLYNMDLGFILPAITGIIVGILLSCFIKPTIKKNPISDSE
ncbi:MAG: branched-chain amino acid transport system II carrier protein [Lachnospiraceae bacterium]